jgi:hypothetical protein
MFGSPSPIGARQQLIRVTGKNRSSSPLLLILIVLSSTTCGFQVAEIGATLQPQNCSTSEFAPGRCSSTLRLHVAVDLRQQLECGNSSTALSDASQSILDDAGEVALASIPISNLMGNLSATFNPPLRLRVSRKTRLIVAADMTESVKKILPCRPSSVWIPGIRCADSALANDCVSRWLLTRNRCVGKEATMVCCLKTPSDQSTPGAFCLSINSTISDCQVGVARPLLPPFTLVEHTVEATVQNAGPSRITVTASNSLISSVLQFPSALSSADGLVNTSLSIEVIGTTAYTTLNSLVRDYFIYNDASSILNPSNSIQLLNLKDLAERIDESPSRLWNEEVRLQQEQGTLCREDPAATLLRRRPSQLSTRTLRQVITADLLPLTKCAQVEGADWVRLNMSSDSALLVRDPPLSQLWSAIIPNIAVWTSPVQDRNPTLARLGVEIDSTLFNLTNG